MNDVEQNIDRLLNLLVSTPTLADQLVEHFDETLHAVDIEISRDQTQLFLKGSTPTPLHRHLIPLEGVKSYDACAPDDYPNTFTVFTTIFTRN